MNQTAGRVATVHVWRVPPRAVPSALVAVATDRQRLRAHAGLHFAKLLGTSRGGTFRPADAMLTRWALVASWISDDAAEQFDASDLALWWQRRAVEAWHATLRPLRTRGHWSRRVPFAVTDTSEWHGPLAVITRARLVPRRALSFWRALPPVVAELHAQPGVAAAFGIGEAPIGVQGTFSIWPDAAAIHDFARRGRAHRDAIRRTTEVGWYAEELFARFGVVRSVGTIDGRDPAMAA
jgi:hypothetical protein